MISQTRTDLMGMPITISIVDKAALQSDIDAVFDYFQKVDERFSTYKKDSEISRINRGEIKEADMSDEMRLVFHLSEQTKNQTQGYFNIKKPDGTQDPSGLVKGWAIHKASNMPLKRGCKNFYIEAGGDIQTIGVNSDKKPWKVGIRNPFDRTQIIKVLEISNKGIATSGTYARGQHVYNPHQTEEKLDTIVSITVVGPNVYEADRFATAAFAMQDRGIHFIESLKDFEGYAIDAKGIATMTSGFEKYMI